MIGRRLLLNLALLLALAAVLWLALGRRPVPDAPALLGVPAAQVEELRVVQPAQPGLHLRRGAQGWRLLAPRQLPADQRQVETVLRFLSGPASARYPRGELDPAVIGLDPPRLQLAVDGRLLEFGTTEGLSGRRYVADAEHVYLVLDGASPLLLAPWWNFIDRRLRAGAGAPQRVLVDGRELAQTQRRAWASLTAARVTPAPAEPPAGPTVRLVLADGKERRLRVRRAAPSGLVDAETDLLYQFETDQLDRLLDTP